MYLGVELGLFAHLRAAGSEGLTTSELADAAGCRPEAIEAWAWAADAHELATLDGDRLTVDEDIAIVLLDEQRPEFLGGQFVHSVDRPRSTGAGCSTSSGPDARSPTGPTATGCRSSG